MRWQQGRQSDNIEDRRGMSMGGMGGGFKIGGMGLLLLLGISLLTGTNPLKLLNYVPQNNPQVNTPAPSVPNNPNSQGYDEQKDFVSRVLGDTEDTWGEIFSQGGKTYARPKLVLFTDMVESAC